MISHVGNFYWQCQWGWAVNPRSLPAILYCPRELQCTNLTASSITTGSWPLQLVH